MSGDARQIEKFMIKVARTFGVFNRGDIYLPGCLSVDDGRLSVVLNWVGVCELAEGGGAITLQYYKDKGFMICSQSNSYAYRPPHTLEKRRPYLTIYFFVWDWLTILCIWGPSLDGQCKGKEECCISTPYLLFSLHQMCLVTVYSPLPNESISMLDRAELPCVWGVLGGKVGGWTSHQLLKVYEHL